MFDSVSSVLPVPSDCIFIVAVRVTGPVLLGFAVVVLEAWLRMPLRPLLDGYVPKIQAFTAGWVRRLPF